MYKVTELTIKQQTGVTAYFATWKFAASSGPTSSSFKVGSLVTIKSGATYYNGVSIPDWVRSDSWYISALNGDRAVLGKNRSGSHDIQSPIKTSNLVGGSSSSSVSVNTLDHFEVKWFYDSGDGVWFSGGSSDTNEYNATYSAPSNALHVKVSVKPVSKTYKNNNTDVSYWTGTASYVIHDVSIDNPENLSAPSVTIDNLTLTATIDNISDAKTDKVEFEVYNGTSLVHKDSATVLTRRATFTWSVNPGGKYRVRCRAINIFSTSTKYGEWSEFSTEYLTPPPAPEGITIIKAKSETSIYLEWSEVKNATSYDLEYTTERRYFDTSDEVTPKNGITRPCFEVTGLAGGDEYFLRVRAVNSAGESPWSEIASLTIGKEPAAPTTWSSTTTVIVGEPLTLYWSHNSEDGSSQTAAIVQMLINGERLEYEIDTAEENDDEKTMFFVVDTSGFTEGTILEWRVCTFGVTNNPGEWSIQRTVNIYSQPTMSLSITNADKEPIDVLTSFPLYISVSDIWPPAQKPIGYHVSITAKQAYETVDHVGNTKIVNEGETVYSKQFDTSIDLILMLSAGHINLENSVEYLVTCVLSMDSGLTATESRTFTVSWTDETYRPNAEIGIDKETLSAYIRPYCTDGYYGPVEGVTLAVYRRDFDGGFTELMSGIPNGSNTFIVDPHPALDFARYRVVATSELTGAVSFYDIPPYPVGEHGIVIQWDEEYRSFDTSNEDALEQRPWTGSMIRLPYNVDITDNNSPDVALVEYIGRKHPVSYYGTQLGQAGTWNAVIPKPDRETIEGLRRLSTWMGDVYVREASSGIGYWANVVVSFGLKHRDLTVPVTLNIKRVSGGV